MDEEIEQKRLIPGEDFPIRHTSFKDRLNAALIDFLLLIPILQFIPHTSTLPYEHPQKVQQAIEDADNKVISIWQLGKIVFNEWVRLGGLEDFLTNTAIIFMVVGFVLILLWHNFSTTPGKFFTSMRIVDATTFKKPKLHQFILRYMGYYVSGLFFMLGFFWIGFNKESRGWHDLISKTMVIYTKPEDPQAKETKFRRQTYMAIAVFILLFLYWFFN